LLRLADADEAHAVGLGGEFLEVRLGLRVIRELVVVADGETEVLLRRGDFRGCGGDQSCKRKEGGWKESHGARWDRRASTSLGDSMQINVERFSGTAGR